MIWWILDWGYILAWLFSIAGAGILGAFMGERRATAKFERIREKEEDILRIEREVRQEQRAKQTRGFTLNSVEIRRPK